MELLAQSLCIDRGERRLIEGLNVDFGSGQAWVVLGPNGSGKSSLLLALAGELSPRAGEIWIGDRLLHSLRASQRAERVAWQGDLPRVEFGSTVAERLDLVPAQSRAPEEALELLDLAPLARRRLYQLSAGERQRVELAAVWLRPAPIWLLDEPTAHLDLRHQVRWLGVLRDEVSSGRCVIVVLHDLTQAHAIADNSLLLFGDGRVVSGRASSLLVPTPLAELYGTPIQQLVGARGNELIPLYSTTRSDPTSPGRIT